MHIPRVICITDDREMEIHGTGILVEMVATWGPYYKIYVDQYACRTCGTIVALPADKPRAMHFEPGYDALEERERVRFLA